jgi:mono/diheme cytochrome c family protein
MIWKIIKVVMYVTPLALLFVGWLIFAGETGHPVRNWLLGNPHMKYQPHLRAFDAQMPLPPEGSVPVSPSGYEVPTTRQARSLKSPLAGASAADLSRGQTYYQYYCVFCHGDQGAGDGPVGASYVPAPADLRGPRVQGMTDGELLRAMLTGYGHEAPDGKSVLGYTVPPEHRWYLVAYVRRLAPGAGGVRQAASSSATP